MFNEGGNFGADDERAPDEEAIIPPTPEKDFDISQLGEPDSEGIRRLIEKMKEEEE